METQSIITMAAKTLEWLERRIVRKGSGHILPSPHHYTFRKLANEILGRYLLHLYGEQLSEQEKDGLKAFFHALRWNDIERTRAVLLAQPRGVLVWPSSPLPLELAYDPEITEALLVALRLVTDGRDESQSVREQCGNEAHARLGQSTEPDQAREQRDRETEAYTTPIQHRQKAIKPKRPQPFRRGEMVFHGDRVELCGVDISSGPRSQTRRRILELLRKKRRDGSFVSYSGRTLAEKVGLKGGQNGAAGAIRDLRAHLIDELGSQASIECGRFDVILSGQRGYHFADCITVRDFGQPVITDITDIEESGGVRNVRNDIVCDVPNDDAGSRRGWVLQQLGEARRLKARDVAERFNCSVKTAERLLQALKKEGRIEFVGPSRTGYYRLRPSAEPSS